LDARRREEGDPVSDPKLEWMRREWRREAWISGGCAALLVGLVVLLVVGVRVIS
jgi:hypothetical protein